MSVSRFSTLKSFFYLSMLFVMVAWFQSALAESRPINDRFLRLGEVNINETEIMQFKTGSAYVRSWNVELDLSFLAPPDELRSKGSGGRHQENDIMAGHSLAFESPVNNEPIILDLESVHIGLEGVVTYGGTVRGDDGSLVAISLHEGEVFGKIHDSNDYSYILQKQHSLEQETLTVIQHTTLPQLVDDRPHHDDDSGAWFLVPNTGSSVKDQGLMGSGGGTVRVLFMYTPAAAASSNVTLVANSLIAQFNQSLNLSNVNTSNSVVLAGMQSIGDDLATYGNRCNVDILYNMRDSDDAFSDLDVWMEDTYADIGLVYATVEPSYSECLYGSAGLGRAGGAAFLIPSGFQHDHPNPYAVTNDTFALGSLNALHEIGHVLNGRHEDGCGLSQPPQACGYVYDDGLDPDGCVWQTMMGGYLTCPFDFTKPPSQQTKPRLARWSNPNVNYGGVPTGTSMANMASALDINMPYASGWGSNPLPPPSAPNPISSSSWYCFGQNRVVWTAQTNATEYRLYHMGSYPYLLYSGPDTQVEVNVASAGYVAAKACNASGCSDYSNQIPVTYYSTCL